MSFSKSTHLIYPKIDIISVAKICVLTSVINCVPCAILHCVICPYCSMLSSILYLAISLIFFTKLLFYNYFSQRSNANEFFCNFGIRMESATGLFRDYSAHLRSWKGGDNIPHRFLGWGTHLNTVNSRATSHK